MEQTAIDTSNQECFVEENSGESIARVYEKAEMDEFPWLTPKYIENVLKTHLNDSTLQIKSMRVEPATAKGDSYAGIMLRSYISYRVKGSTSVIDTSLVLKTQIWNELTEKTLKVYDIHNKEMTIYEQILSKIRHLLLSIGEPADIFPIAVYVDRDNDVIIFEDLLLNGYQMKNRVQGLDKQHSLMALSKLAIIQAASAVLYEMDNRIYSTLKSGMFTRLTDCFHTFFHTYWSSCVNEVCQWEGFEHYGEKMHRMLDDVVENACKTYDLEDGDLHTLTHGDLWFV